MPVHLQMF